ncbi:MAG TPA: hypothetical protein VFP84_23940 [Kofleriaceae bacterium]|nr:hypothetical protein [Kofleriaceae bacterium]
MMRIAALVVLLGLAACAAPAPPTGSPAALAAYLSDVIHADAVTRARAVATWRLDEPAWRRTVIAGAWPLYPAYVRAFDREAPAMLDRLARADRAAPVAARRHFAGDAALTPAQARVRWLLPTLFPSAVAADAGPIDTVFVADGAAWRALIGLDTALRAHIACPALAHAGPAGPCSDAAAALVTAALGKDSAQVARLCPLAAALCGKGSP